MEQAESLVQPHLHLAVAALCVIYLSTNNSDFLKYTDVRLLGDFHIGATNPDHTFLKRVHISTVSFPGEGLIFQQEVRSNSFRLGEGKYSFFLG